MTADLFRTIAGRFADRRRTATEHVVALLREAIASGELAGGTQLPQIELAEALGVSRTPVREALRLLEAEGWITFSPHRGAVVAALSSADVREIFEIRFALEALALRKSVPTLSDDAFLQAEQILANMDTERDIGRWVALNRRFHMTLYAGAGSRLTDLIAAQYDAVDRYLRIELVELDNAAVSQVEHREILAACRARDVDLAVRLCEPHIAGAGDDLGTALDDRRTTTA
jgi:DNA-binding GntR family transcriptional regulator